MNESQRLKLAVFASGRGSNFLAINEAIKRKEVDVEIAVLISDQAGAPVLLKAQAADIPTHVFDYSSFDNKAAYEAAVVEALLPYRVDMIALAGYMRMVGSVLLAAYPQRILNIHPSLLPAFPGLHAQRQAVEYGAKVSGCTVHLVDEGMDTGAIVLQATVPVYFEDDEDSLSVRILAEEHKIYARALQLFAENRIHIEGRKVKLESSKRI